MSVARRAAFLYRGRCTSGTLRRHCTRTGGPMSQIPSSPTYGVGLRPHRGTLVLVLGILSIIVCQIILGPIAWAMASGDLKEMDAGRMDPSGRGNTHAAKILGIVGTIMGILGLVLGIVYFVFV